MRVAARALLAVGALVSLAPSATAEPVPVHVGLLAINFGNHDVNKGTYVIDFYLWFRWDPSAAPEGFSPERFEIMNGRAVSRDRIADETDPATGEREVWFRIQANLYSDPRFARYPFDHQRIAIALEDAVHPSDKLVYVPVEEGVGLDDGFRVSGWRIEGTTTDIVEKAYPFDESYSRLLFSVEVARETLSTAFKTFLPPTAFVLVAGLGFFLHRSKVANRLTLGTSMLIAAVMFHISQTVSLPPLGSLILFDKIMIAVYTFIAGTLAVATLIAIDEDFWPDRDHTNAINRYGALAAVTLPIVVYGVLELL